jgi:hemerythrin-like metal-binding protein
MRKEIALRVERIAWSDDLETGIEEIDFQHKEYLDRVNLLLDKCQEGSRIGLMLGAFDYLDKYMREHLKLEEHLMFENRYPEYVPHWEEHKKFKENLKDIKSVLEDHGFDSELGMRLNYFLVEWFFNHVRSDDVKLCKFLHSKLQTEKKLSMLIKRLVKKYFS